MADIPSSTTRVLKVGKNREGRPLSAQHDGERQGTGDNGISTPRADVPWPHSLARDPWRWDGEELRKSMVKPQSRISDRARRINLRVSVLFRRGPFWG